MRIAIVINYNTSLCGRLIGICRSSGSKNVFIVYQREEAQRHKSHVICIFVTFVCSCAIYTCCLYRHALYARVYLRDAHSRWPITNSRIRHLLLHSARIERSRFVVFPMRAHGRRIASACIAIFCNGNRYFIHDRRVTCEFAVSADRLTNRQSNSSSAKSTARR